MDSILNSVHTTNTTFYHLQYTPIWTKVILPNFNWEKAIIWGNKVIVSKCSTTTIWCFDLSQGWEPQHLARATILKNYIRIFCPPSKKKKKKKAPFIHSTYLFTANWGYNGKQKRYAFLLSWSFQSSDGGAKHQSKNHTNKYNSHILTWRR